jgi:hypothetical protein
VAALKAQFAGKTKSLVCASAIQKYLADVEKWEANLPLSREAHLENMKVSLNRALTTSKKWKSFHVEIDRSPDRDVTYALRTAMDSPRGSGDEGSSADGVCMNLKPNITPDATMYMSDSFVAGPMVVKYPEAKGILFHELGHRLYYFLNYDKNCADRSAFQKTQACLLENHSELSSEEMKAQKKTISLGNASAFESEDWADLVSSQVDSKSTNFACLFARKFKDQDYQELELKNKDESDVHSSYLFRLLHLNFLRTGQTPAACERALAARGEKVMFKNCLPK